MRITLEGDFKKLELPWGTTQRDTKERMSMKKGLAALSSMDRGKQRRRCKIFSLRIFTIFEFEKVTCNFCLWVINCKWSKSSLTWAKIIFINEESHS